jgi:hypothetical protein
MQKVTALPQTVDGSPRWFRVAMPVMMFLNALLGVATTGLRRLEWLPWFCMGCCLLLIQPKPRKTLRSALKSPRFVLSIVLIAAALAGFGHNLYGLFLKYFSN